jgi:hypothetical protein
MKMNRISRTQPLQWFFPILVVLTVACSGGGKKSPSPASVPPVESKSATIVPNEEAMKLLKYLEESGDYVNGRNFPSLIKAAAVFKELEGNTKIIDLREPAALQRATSKEP